jgi:hypothetical protein
MIFPFHSCLQVTAAGDRFFSCRLFTQIWMLFFGMIFYQPMIVNGQFNSALDTEDPITVNALVGFDPELPSRRSNTWAPITVELTNHEKDIEGYLTIGLKDGNVLYRTPIDLPTKTKKAFRLLTYIPGDLDELEFSIETGRWKLPIETITVTAMQSETFRFLAVISPDRGAHNHFAHRPEDDSDFYRRVIYTTPFVFPRYWVGFQNLDAILWDGGNAGELSLDQESALEKWIQMGGTLILAAGARWQELDASPFQHYVPMTFTGSRVLEAGTELESVGEAVRPVLQSGAVIAVGAVLDDPLVRVRMKAGDDPFLIERKWGAGRIVYVASTLTQPLFVDEEHDSIFKDFLTAASIPFPSTTMDQLDTPITSYLRWISQAELPSTLFIAAYLGCYIIIVVPVNYFVFRRFRRLEWAWFTVPIWALIFAYGAYYIGALRQQGQVSVNEVSVIEARPSADTAQTTTYCSIYSPVRQWYTLIFDQIPAFPQLPSIFDYRRGSETTSDESLNVRYAEEGPAVDDYLIYHWSQRILKTFHETPIGDGVKVDLKWEGNQINGTITNNTGMSLINPRLYTRDRMVRLYDTFEDGQTITVEESINAMQLFDRERIAREAPGRQFEMVRQRMQAGIVDDKLQELYAAVLLDQPTSKTLAVFTAQLSRSVFDFSLNEKPVRPDGNSLFCVVFPLQQIFHGTKLIDSWRPSSAAPPGWNRGYGMYGMGGMMPGQGGMGFHFVQNNMTSNWDLVTDVPLMGGRVESLRIEMNYKKFQLLQPQAMNIRNRGVSQVTQITDGASSFLYNQPNGCPPVADYELHVLDRATTEYKPLSAITNDEGLIIDPERYLEKITGKISFQLKAPPKLGLQFLDDAISIQLFIDYGTGEGDKFLGYPL